MATSVPTPNSETITLNDPGNDVEKSVQAPKQDPNEVERQPSESAGSSVDSSDPYCCQLAPEDDPKQLRVWRKWLAVCAISSSSLCATFASSVVRHISSFVHCYPTQGLTECVCCEQLSGSVHGGRARARLAYCA